MSARAVTLLLLAGSLLVGTAGPAVADPARPTNYRSVVTELSPAVEGLGLEVLGGDAYVVVRAPAGSTVEVAGYDGEPYLRFGPDGTVERNEASPARWINDDRYDTTVPPEASAEAPPRWEVVATDGEYAWHDHRVHWMSPELPRHVDPASDEVQRVNEWTLDLTVDGQPVRAAGQLDWVPGPSPLVPVALVLVAVAAAAVLGWALPRRGPWFAIAAGAIAGAGALAATVGLPAGADRDPPVLVLPAVAVLAGLVAVWARRSRPGTGATLFGAVAAVPVLVWLAIWAGTLTRPIVPTTLPVGVMRGVVAVALGFALAAFVATARQLLRADETAYQPVRES